MRAFGSILVFYFKPQEPNLHTKFRTSAPERVRLVEEKPRASSRIEAPRVEIRTHAPDNLEKMMIITKLILSALI